VTSSAGAAQGTPLPALSTFDAAMIVCGIVIGGGIFSLPPLIASISGSADRMFAAWGLGAALTLVGSLCYAELAATFPHAGGDYHFLTRAFGRDVSFFYGWARATVITTGPTALHAYIFGDYASRILPLGGASSSIYAALVVVLLTALNILGLKESSRTQNVITLLLIAGMALVAIGGFQTPASAVPAAPAPNSASWLDSTLVLGSALLFVLYAYGGWNEAAYISAELRGGQRAILTALLAAIVVITALYLVFVAALQSGLGFEGLKATQAPAADVALHAFGGFGQTLIAGIVCLSTLTSSNATMIVGARSNYALALDWPIVSFMARWDRERGVPVGAYLVQGGVTLALVALAAREQSGVQWMVDFTAPVFWFFFLLTGIALFVLRRKYVHVTRAFSVPLYPLPPLIFVGTCCYLFWSSLKFAHSQHALPAAVGLMAAGLVAWLIARLRRK